MARPFQITAPAAKALRPVLSGLASLFALLWLALLPAQAQDLPDWQHVRINDFADLLTPEDAQTIDTALALLKDQTGIEGTVVTLSDRARYGGTDGLEPFATRLFNHWGVGEATRNDGFMVLVLAQDREARIELGSGYENDADILAQEIMRNTMLPALRDGRISHGIREATQAVIELIAQPTAAGHPAGGSKDSLMDRLVPYIFGGAWLLILGGIARQIWRRNRCPQCGRRGLETATTPLETPLPEGGHLVSHDNVTRRCLACGWTETRQSLRPRTVWYGPTGTMLRSEPTPGYRSASRGSSGFGGGSSRGGGASGRW
ncbi:TPM domain-containing protein [Paracoccus methylovorus]|uniref:TPM domain-containing protein n=1 Tax=Paracoccus methylovorus TaxID=2812658 RepID=A0ABX7JME6_9RHOB|nr:TPM domain-containing protein [Paracoccus methylovorus]QRZ15407.1 TPM domain-containing protein [Paracoccus methylovorus]